MHKTGGDRPIISTGVKVARVTHADLPGLLLQRVARVQFINGKVLPEYFFEWLQSSHFIGAIDPGRSNGVPHISPKDVEKIVFTVPSMSEQHRIVAYLDGLQNKADALKQLQAATAAELDALLPSVLDKAFKGELLPPGEAISISVSAPAQQPVHFSDLADLVVRAYFDVRDGWSTEYLLSSPALTQRFIERCGKLGAQRTPKDLLSTLINARRASALKGMPKAKSFSIPRAEMDLFSFASEMAFRCIQDRIQDEQQRELSVDAMLTNPVLATEFDQFAARLAPGYEPLQFRWTAISLRKERKICKEMRPLPLFEEFGRTDDVRVSKLPEAHGVFWVEVDQKPLFVGVADNLRSQVDRLLAGTKKRIAPDWIQEEIDAVPRLHVLTMPGQPIAELEMMRANVLRAGISRLNFLGGTLFKHVQ